MKAQIISYLTIAIVFSCQSNDQTELIESIFELKLPNCYEVLEEADEKFDYAPHTIVELKFEEECMRKMYNEQMKPMRAECGKYYIGTTIWAAPCWHNYEQKAVMFLDLRSGILHFEDYD